MWRSSLVCLLVKCHTFTGSRVRFPQLCHQLWGERLNFPGVYSCGVWHTTTKVHSSQIKSTVRSMVSSDAVLNYICRVVNCRSVNCRGVNCRGNQMSPTQCIIYVIECDYMRLYAIICDYMLLYAIICDYMLLYAIICYYILLFAIICWRWNFNS